MFQFYYFFKIFVIMRGFVIEQGQKMSSLKDIKQENDIIRFGFQKKYFKGCLEDGFEEFVLDS